MKKIFEQLDVLNQHLKQGDIALKYGQVEQAKEFYTQALQAAKDAVASTHWLSEKLITEATDRMARLQTRQRHLAEKK